MAFSDPKQVIQESGLTEGALVGDFGAGSGHYSLAAARAVGVGGRVYAIDIQSELLSRLARDAAASGLRNIEVISGDLEEVGGSKLKSGMLDVVIVSNVLFQSEHRAQMLAEVKRVLKPTGRVICIEWKGSFGGIGPRPGDVVSEPIARELFERAGFRIERALKHTGDEHYGFIARILEHE